MVRFCNLCKFPIVKINASVFGQRCIKCRSSFIHRAMGKVLDGIKLDENAYVHEFSNHGAIYSYLRKRFKCLTTSEYFDNVASGEIVNGVQCQDVQQLSFANHTYDLFTSTEVFEHVPDDVKGFSEVYRCLKPAGYFVFTVPINEVPTTVERAKIEKGEIVHMLEPEYHGDHMRSKGILAFRNYGLDIKQKLEKVGFRNVELHLIEDASKAIIPAKRVIACQK
jgi:SAM-dependent methyltransferase